MQLPVLGPPASSTGWKHICPKQSGETWRAVVGHACNASAQGVEAGEMQGHGWLYSEHQASLGHLRPCHKRRRERGKEEEMEKDNTGRKKKRKRTLEKEEEEAGSP